MTLERAFADGLPQTVDLSGVAEHLAAALLQVQPQLDEMFGAVAEHIQTILAPQLEELARVVAGSIDQAALRVLAETAQASIERSGLLEALEGTGYRARLYELAARHHGYVSVDMAHAAGVPAVEVRKIASRGGLDNVARGVYRATGIDGGERAPFAEAVLRVGDTAHLLGDAVLAYHNLAFVNPTRIKVGTDRRVRRELPAHIEVVHTSIPEADITEYDGVRSTTVERALRDSIGAVMPERLVEAAHQAVEEGLIRRRAVAPLLAEIGAAA